MKVDVEWSVFLNQTVSINVGPAVGGKRSCELNNATDESPEQSALKGDSDYIHYAVEVIR